MHIPWCVRKCPYCDFNSHEARAEIPEAEYLAALEADIQYALPQVWGRRIVSIFFGGGTPSLLSAAGLDRLLTTIRTLLPLQPDAEITLEANPSTAEAGKFAARASILSVPMQVLPEALSHSEINDQLGLPSAYTDAVSAWIQRALMQVRR